MEHRGQGERRVEISVKNLLQTLICRGIPNNVCISSALKEVEFNWLSRNVGYEGWLPALEPRKRENEEIYNEETDKHYLNKVIEADVDDEKPSWEQAPLDMMWWEWQFFCDLPPWNHNVSWFIRSYQKQGKYLETVTVPGFSKFSQWFSALAAH